MGETEDTGDTRKTRSIETNYQSLYGLIETAAAIRGPTGVPHQVLCISIYYTAFSLVLLWNS